MNDEMFDRDYQSARAEMNAGIDRAVAHFVQGLKQGFTALHRSQWQAPWETPARRQSHRRRAGLA